MAFVLLPCGWMSPHGVPHQKGVGSAAPAARREAALGRAGLWGSRGPGLLWEPEPGRAHRRALPSGTALPGPAAPCTKPAPGKESKVKAATGPLGDFGWDLSVSSRPAGDLPPCPAAASAIHRHTTHGRAAPAATGASCARAGHEGAPIPAAQHLWARNPTDKIKFANILLLLVRVVSRLRYDTAAMCVGEPG